MSNQYPEFSPETNSEPLLRQGGHNPLSKDAPVPPQNAYPHQPGYGYGVPQPEFREQPVPVPLLPPPMDNLEAPFRIKGVVELQKEFGAEEIRIVPKQKHVCSLLINLMLWASRLFIIVTLVGSSVDPFGWEHQVENLRTLWFLFLVAEVLMLIEFFCSGTLRYLWNKTLSDSIRDYVVKMKQTRPAISMSCQCYHYDTRLRYVNESYTVNGPNGPETRNRQRVETYQEKVVSFCDSENFDFTHFQEISRMISDDIYHNDLIKIRFSEKIEFGDPFTRGAYDRQLASFIARNKNRDTLFSLDEHMGAPGLIHRMFSMNGDRHSRLVHWFWYLFFTLLGFSWPFRMWLETNCVRGEFKFHYVVFRDPSRFGY